MEPNEQEQLPPKKQSTRTYQEWVESLRKILAHNGRSDAVIVDQMVKPYYDQCLMPEVCFKELFNR